MSWNNRYIKLFGIISSLILVGAACSKPSLTANSSKTISNIQAQDIGKAVVLVSPGNGNEFATFATGIVLPIQSVSSYYLDLARASAQLGGARLSDNIAWVMIKKQTLKALCGDNHNLCPRMFFPYHSDDPDQRIVKSYYTASDPVATVDLKDQDISLLLFAKQCLSVQQGGDCWGDKEFGDYFLSNFSKNTSFCPNNLTIGSEISILSYPENASSTKEEILDVSTGKITSKIDGGYQTDAKIVSGNSGGFAFSNQNGKPCIVGLTQTNSIAKTEHGVIYTINPN